jgi:2'-phosphotransferase
MESVRLSKFLSFVLRHGALKEGIPIRSDGFVAIEDLLKHKKCSQVTFEDIQQVVAKDEKSRYLMELMDGKWMIRANQGHSMNLQVEMILITDPAEIPVVLHGTIHKAWTSIKQQGLSVMNRQHIHFAVGKLGEDGVKSGMRKSCTVFIYIDSKKAMQDGIQFFRSANNVILSPGINGWIAPQYFERVEDKNGTLLPF